MGEIVLCELKIKGSADMDLDMRNSLREENDPCMHIVQPSILQEQQLNDLF